MDKDTQVYCTDCVYGDDAVKAMYFDSPNNGNLPEQCKTCYSFDMEDSRPFELRKNYRAKGGYVKDPKMIFKLGGDF